MGHDVGLSTRVPGGTFPFLPRRATARSQSTRSIPSRTITPGLIEGDPMLHPVAKLPEAHVCIIAKVFPAKFGPVHLEWAKYTSPGICSGPIVWTTRRTRMDCNHFGWLLHTILSVLIGRIQYLERKIWGIN